MSKERRKVTRIEFSSSGKLLKVYGRKNKLLIAYNLTTPFDCRTAVKKDKSFFNKKFKVNYKNDLEPSREWFKDL